MALMFQRLARNFAKNGYFPTDEATMERVVSAIDSDAHPVAILDPCCGEGTALAEVKQTLTEHGAAVRSYGVEYNAERAWHAKQLLDVVAHSDVHDMAMKVRTFGLLFLNPPYGDLVSDKAALSEAGQGKQRLEKVFFRRAHPWLAFDGVLVIIIPHYVLDAEFANMIARSYADVQVFMAPEQRFKQCVILGRKRKSDYLDAKLETQLAEIGRGTLPPAFPEVWSAPLFRVPACRDEPHFVAARINAKELGHELQKLHGQSLWPQFDRHFAQGLEQHRQPLRRLSDWHLALALAAGQINGVVRSADGRTLVVKGDTYKDKTLKVTFEEGGKAGEMREIRTLTDRFVPVIRAIDMTPGGMYGNLVTIQ